MLNPKQLDAVLKPIIEQMRGAYLPEFRAARSDAELLGFMISKYLRWDGDDILTAAESALEDANFHDEAAVVRKMKGE